MTCGLGEGETFPPDEADDEEADAMDENDANWNVAVLTGIMI